MIRRSQRPKRLLLLTLAAVLAGGSVTIYTAFRDGAPHASAADQAPRPVVPAPPMPVITVADLRYATTPAPGVWAELKVILDNPLPSGRGSATRTVLILPSTMMEDFKLRTAEPKLLSPPTRRSDGRYAFTFDAPLAESYNWYRLLLEVRRTHPRRLDLTLMIDSPLFETRMIKPRVAYADRENDPFVIVPESMLGWVPGRPASALPVLVLYTVAVSGAAIGGIAAAFWAVRR